MNPPAPVSGEICVDMARMPDGRIAAMKPEPLAFTNLASRIGSPATKGARAIEPDSFSMALGRSLLRMKLPVAALAGQSCHCTSPGDTVLPIGDVGFGDEDLDRGDFGRRRGLDLRRLFRTAGQHGGNATGCDGDGQHNKTRGFHTLHSHRDMTAGSAA